MPLGLRFPLYAILTLASAFTAAAQGPHIKWVCDPKVQRLYRRDLGVVCWDGQTYRKDDPGGIPQYMVDYFDQMRRNLDEKVGAMRHANNTERAPARTAVPVPRATPAAPRKPVSPDLFSSVAKGMKRSEVLDKLGDPAGAITIPADEGFVEVWTYSMTDGGTAKVRIEAGAVVSTHRLP